jgi:hypothetical protein
MAGIVFDSPFPCVLLGFGTGIGEARVDALMAIQAAAGK